MMQGMARLLLLMFGIGLILTILALISCLSAEEGEVRALPRLVWIFVILVVPVVGAIMYLSVGRPLPEYTLGTGLGGGGGPGAGGRIWRTAAGLSTREQRVVAPDDDPDFLRGIDTNRRAQDEETLRRWEEEFRNRDDDQHKRDTPRDDSPPSDG
jgi:Phospholipase_D-nuclease N-terminal